MDDPFFALELASQVPSERRFGVEFVIVLLGPLLRSLVSVFKVLAPLCVVEVHGGVGLGALQRRIQNHHIVPLLTMLLLLLDGGWTAHILFGRLVGTSDPLGARLEVCWCDVSFYGTLFSIDRNFL